MKESDCGLKAGYKDRDFENVAYNPLKLKSTKKFYYFFIHYYK